MSPGRSGRTCPLRRVMGVPIMSRAAFATASASTRGAALAATVSTGACQGVASGFSGSGTGGHRSTRPGIPSWKAIWAGVSPKPWAASPWKTASVSRRIAGEERKEWRSAASCMGWPAASKARENSDRRASKTAMSAPWKE